MNIIKSPWVLEVPRKTKPPKRYAMSMNNYRNAHHRVNAGAKKFYTRSMEPQLRKLPSYEKICLVFVLYPPTKRRLDLDNHGAIHSKYLQDALVTYGVIKDDDYLHVSEVVFLFGEVDKADPRVDVYITEDAYVGKATEKL